MYALIYSMQVGLTRKTTSPSPRKVHFHLEKSFLNINLNHPFPEEPAYKFQLTSWFFELSHAWVEPHGHLVTGRFFEHLCNYGLGQRLKTERDSTNARWSEEVVHSWYISQAEYMTRGQCISISCLKWSLDRLNLIYYFNCDTFIPIFTPDWFLFGYERLLLKMEDLNGTIDPSCLQDPPLAIDVINREWPISIISVC